MRNTLLSLLQISWNTRRKLSNINSRFYKETQNKQTQVSSNVRTLKTLCLLDPLIHPHCNTLNCIRLQSNLKANRHKSHPNLIQTSLRIPSWTQLPFIHTETTPEVIPRNLCHQGYNSRSLPIQSSSRFTNNRSSNFKVLLTAKRSRNWNQTRSGRG
jgi:hypothetical protein